MSTSAVPVSTVDAKAIPRKKSTRGVSGKAVLKGLAARTLHPKHLLEAAKLQINRRKHRHSTDDAQLALYSRILPTDFLHYGYFDEPDRRPEDMSLTEVGSAQKRYADLLLELVTGRDHPVLDVGCGMGGLSRMLRERGFCPTALTPDRLQAAHVAKTLPSVPVMRCKFEAMDTADHTGKYGTIFTSESLQYLKLDKALPALRTILRPGGRWIACDYFHRRPSNDPSLHEWSSFKSRVVKEGWRFVHEQDITGNVTPMLGYLHMWATRFGLPLLEFSLLRLRRKQPGLHHLLGGMLDVLTKTATENIALIDPHQFALSKQYMLIAMERA